MRKYRSLVAWQRARESTLHTFKATNDAYHPRANALFDQLRRAVLSIELNIVEGYAEYLPQSATKRLAQLLDEILACLHGLLRRFR